MKKNSLVEELNKIKLIKLFNDFFLFFDKLNFLVLKRQRSKKKCQINVNFLAKNLMVCS